MSNPPRPAPTPRASGASIGFDFLYAALAVLLLPYFIHRRIKGKKSAPWAAKMARISERASNVERLWIHAVSVGEANAAETLYAALKKSRSAAEIVFSTTTVTGFAVAEKKYGSQNVLVYPHDFSWVVKRFLDRVKPSVIILMELEVWPNMLREARARNIPVIVVNARITERSAKRYALGWSLIGGAFRRVDLWLAQSAEYAERLVGLGVDASRVETSGNIKYDAVDTSLPDPRLRAELRAELGIAPDARVLIGGSTHPSEEAVLLSACKLLREKSAPNIRLILVPRHPERLKSVEAEITAAGYSCLRLSALRAKTHRSDDAVILVDVMGELKKLYAAADVAFVGGSLIPHGGQNIMEPCGLGVPTLHGPHMHNFNDAMEILRGCNGAREVSRDTLADSVEQLLANRDDAAAMAARAREGFLMRQGATAIAARRIGDFL